MNTLPMNASDFAKGVLDELFVREHWVYSPEDFGLWEIHGLPAIMSFVEGRGSSLSGSVGQIIGIIYRNNTIVFEYVSKSSFSAASYDQRFLENLETELNQSLPLKGSLIRIDNIPPNERPFPKPITVLRAVFANPFWRERHKDLAERAAEILVMEALA